MGWTRNVGRGRVALAILATAVLLVAFGGVWSAGASDDVAPDPAPTDTVETSVAEPAAVTTTTAPPVEPVPTSAPSDEPAAPSIAEAPPTTEPAATVPTGGPAAAATLDVEPFATGSESDDRAEYVADPSVGNECANAGLSGTTYTTGDNPSPGSTNVGPGLFTVTIADYDVGDIQAPFQIQNGGSPAGDATMLQLSGISASVTINGVVVKGGPGYNKYVFGTNAGYVGVNMISPLNNGGKVPRISHALVCYDAEPTGSLDVSKSLVGDGVPEEGLGWTVTVTCTDPAFETTLDFAPGDLGPKTVSGIPLDGDGENSCSVSETDTGTTPSGWTLVVSYSPPDGENGNSAAQTVNADTSPSFTVTNTYSQLPGALDLEKVVSGPVPAGTEFEVTVSCSLENVVVDGFPVVVTFDENGDVVPPPPLPLTDIPAGAECSVEETGTGGAIAVTYSPDGGTPSDPPTVTIVANDTVSVTVTNTFGEVGGEFSGSVNVQKAVVGGPPADDTQFVVNVHCVGVTVDVSQDITLVYPDELEGSLSFEAPSIESVECTVIEKDPLGGAVKATISPNDGVVTLTVNAPVADVVVTNDYGDPVVGVGGATAVRDVLPFTGSTFDMLLKSAVLLLVAGTATWLVVRRRRGAASPLS